MVPVWQGTSPVQCPGEPHRSLAGGGGWAQDYEAGIAQDAFLIFPPALLHSPLLRALTGIGCSGHLSSSVAPGQNCATFFSASSRTQDNTSDGGRFFLYSLGWEGFTWSLKAAEKRAADRSWVLQCAGTVRLWLHAQLQMTPLPCLSGADLGHTD